MISMDFLYPKNPTNWSNFREPWDTALKIAGFNIFDDGYRSTKTTLIRVFGWFSLTHFCSSALIYSHNENWNLEMTSEAISVLTVGLIIIIQTMTLRLNQREFKKLTSLLDSYWSSTNTDEEQFKILADRGKEGCRAVFVLSLLVFSTMANFTLTSLCQRKQSILPLIFPAYGFHTLDRFYYIANFIYHNFIMSYVCTGLLPFHSFYVHLALQIVAQLDILSLQINRLGKHEHSTKHVHEVLRHCYHRHLEVIWCIKQVSSTFKLFMCAQVFLSTLLISLAMFTIFNHSSFTSLNKAMIFLSAALLHLFIFCWYGELINTGSENLSHGIYDSSWEDLEPKHRRILILMLRNTQVPVRVRVRGVFDVRLETFTLILRSAYSWCALLSTVNEH